MNSPGPHACPLPYPAGDGSIGQSGVNPTPAGHLSSARPRRANRYEYPVIEIARAALQRAPFVRTRTHWSYRGRLFSNGTVRKLVDSGEAVIIGDRVEAV